METKTVKLLLSRMSYFICHLLRLFYPTYGGFNVTLLIK